MTIIRDTDGGWTQTDRILAVAHTIAQGMRCDGCGQPKHEAWNPDSEGWFEPKSAVCQGCDAVKRDADGQHGHDHARKVWVVDTRPRDVQLRPWNPQ